MPCRTTHTSAGATAPACLALSTITTGKHKRTEMAKWQSREDSQGRVLDGIPIYRAPFVLAISLSPPHQLGKWLSGKSFAKPPVDGILARESARAYVCDHANEIVLKVAQDDSGNMEPLSALQTPPAPDSPRVDTVRRTVTVYLPGSQAVSRRYFRDRVLSRVLKSSPPAYGIGR